MKEKNDDYLLKFSNILLKKTHKCFFI